MQKIRARRKNCPTPSMIPNVDASAGALKTCMVKTRGETKCSGESFLKQSNLKGNCSLVYEKSVF